MTCVNAFSTLRTESGAEQANPCPLSTEKPPSLSTAETVYLAHPAQSERRGSSVPGSCWHCCRDQSSYPGLSVCSLSRGARGGTPSRLAPEQQRHWAACPLVSGSRPPAPPVPCPLAIISSVAGYAPQRPP